MRVLFNCPIDDPAGWIPELRAQQPEIEVEVWPKNRWVMERIHEALRPDA
ncbi:MAG: hypothetical protein HYR63_07445 [Proteobacteria bacterium]|nr:hypothetical protein [Pseudomonadota bacterium]MBI3496130.1 hypothetical protein [Pseudomonadota bacterium]